MTVTSTVAARRALLLAALVAVLFVGLVAMHHMSAAPSADGAPAAMAAEGATDHTGAERSPDGPHEDHASSLLHLCLAVLTAVAVLAAAVLAWRTRIGVVRVPTRSRSGRPRTAPRAPPPSAPARLALLCVLRT